VIDAGPRQRYLGFAATRWQQMSEHTQRISLFLGMPTFWPAPLRSLFHSLAGRSKWLTAQRTRTARHVPTGTTS